MAKKKGERLAQQRLCKRRKYLEIKNDPHLYALEKEKQRAKYAKRKREKKQTPISGKKKFRLICQKVIESIEKFYNDDAVSSICAGKKDFVTKNKRKMQKRYLTAPLKTLHKKLLTETDVKVSYSFFTKYRLFWVLHPKPTNRETCLCAQHTNTELLIQALHIAQIIDEKNSSEVVSYLCCEPKNDKCLKRQCVSCKNKILIYKEFSDDSNLTYFKWGKTTKEIATNEGLKKKQVLTIKDKITTTPSTAVKELEAMLSPFFLHVYNIDAQYSTMKNLKKNLTVSEAVIHVDFSENYSLKYAEEVQSFHFKGSRQLTDKH